MSPLDDPRPMAEPAPYRPQRPEGRTGEVGEGPSGVLLAVAAVVGLIGFGIVLLLFPALLAWLISLGLLVLVLVMIAVVVVSVVVGILSIGVGAYQLIKPREVQGPEHSYTLDMVKEPKRRS